MNTDIITCAFREIKQARLRTFTVVTGFAITVALMVITASILIYSRVAENKVLAATGTHFINYIPNCGDITSLSEEEIANLAKGIIPKKCKELCHNCTGCNKKPIDILNEGFIINTNTTRLVTLELVKRIAALETVKDASGYLLFRFRDPVSGRLFSVGGLDPHSTAVQTTCCSKADLISGTFLTPAMVGKVMLEHGYAANFNLQPGNKISVASESFEIVGIVNSGARPGKADVYMLFSEAERVINRRIKNPLFQEANVILIEAIDSSRHEQAIADVKALVKNEAIVTYGCYKPAAEAIGLNEKSIWLFLLIISIGAILFAGKAQWSSVIERRHSFAILKAIGWTNKVIVLQLLTESLVQSVLGSLLGAGSGMAIILFFPIAKMLGIEASLDHIWNSQMVVIVLLFSVVAGAIACVIPVLIAVRQRPAELMRRV